MKASLDKTMFDQRATFALPLGLSFAHSDTARSSKHNTICPDLLISGSTFLKGTDYIALDSSNPPAKVERPRVRYFDDPPTNTLTENRGESSKEISRESMDWSQILCLKCGKVGHLDCSKELVKAARIKWKPEIEYREMSKELKNFKGIELGDDMEMNISYHLKSIAGAVKAKPNSTLAIKEKYLKYKKRLKKSRKVYCCHCGDHHKLKECPMGGKRRKPYVNKKSSSDSDGSTNTNEMTTEEFILDALKHNKKLPAKFLKTSNRGLLKRCIKMIRA
eukprot:TRINITY_DN2347_c0_g1_i1.p1 TRINITY_DN2347_c0_g1~~TRINITY_DN2347_c0_g1_i1.p1  ORF type:complete len:301 (+),score=51.56 TRINITY_DN2347_c0_g1_i1:73-903(+)